MRATSSCDDIADMNELDERDGVSDDDPLSSTCLKNEMCEYKKLSLQSRNSKTHSTYMKDDENENGIVNLRLLEIGTKLCKKLLRNTSNTHTNNSTQNQNKIYLRTKFKKKRRKVLLYIMYSSPLVHNLV